MSSDQPAESLANTDINTESSVGSQPSSAPTDQPSAHDAAEGGRVPVRDEAGPEASPGPGTAGAGGSGAGTSIDGDAATDAAEPTHQKTSHGVEPPSPRESAAQATDGSYDEQPGDGPTSEPDAPGASDGFSPIEASESGESGYTSEAGSDGAGAFGVEGAADGQGAPDGAASGSAEGGIGDE